ncbi:MAG: stalk domain-containing protein [Clostridia bacterium]|nr:stalk domain-containing protein [Clostridia bacterium]
MKRSKKAILAAGLIAGAAAMTGCTANTTPASTPTPQPAQQVTAEPATAEPAPETADSTQPEESGDETPAPIGLLADGKEVTVGAAKEQGMLLLPLVETAEAMGWDADSQQLEEETQTKRTITLDKDGSRITVSWTVSDNTTRQITWQKDGLLIPVDTKITTIGDVVYVPASFFEVAMEAGVDETQDGVSVTSPEPKETPETEEQTE